MVLIIGTSTLFFFQFNQRTISAQDREQKKVATPDGLIITFTPKTKVTLAGVDLPETNQPGGLLVRDATRKPKPNLLSNPGFAEGINGWQIKGKGMIEDKLFHSGKESLLLEGPGENPTQTTQLESAVLPVKRGVEYIVGFWACGKELARYDEIGHRVWNWKAYVVQSDKNGHKTAPDFIITFPKPTTPDFPWTLVESSFRTHHQTEYLKICFEVFRGNGKLWIDDLFLCEAGSGPEVLVGGQFSHSQEEVVQRSELKEMNLTFQAKYRVEAERIEAQVEVSDTSGQDRALQVGFRLPIDLTTESWKWEEDLDKNRMIMPQESYYRWFEFGPGRFCNVLPFSAVSGKRQGLAIGVPMDTPRIFRISYQPEGLEIWFDLGLSQDTALFPSKANFRFILYTYPAKWGLRAAVQKYYQIFPQFFERRAKKVGNCHTGLWYASLRNPEDFSLRFGGYNTGWSSQNNMYTFIYTEPWGWWMPWQYVKPGETIPQPSYQEILDRLQQYAQTDPAERNWSYMLPIVSLSEMAQAILNSGIYDPQGKLSFRGGEMWNTWGGNIIHQYCDANPDPDIKLLPTRASIFKEIETEPRFKTTRAFGLKMAGVYLDSVVDAPQENYRREHWKVTKQPLVFNPVTRNVCQLFLFPAYDFISRLSDEMRNGDCLVLANAFPYTHTFFAHLIDVFLCEGAPEHIHKFRGSPLRGMKYLHLLAGTKPISFYDYDWWHKSVSAQLKEHRLKECLFYGVFPGLPWQDPNFREDYKEGLEASEILRPLCRKYFPAIERVAEAGWQPITGASTDDSAILVERYGDGRQNNLCFTLRNETDRERPFTMTIYPEEVGLISLNPGLIMVDLVSGEEVPFQVRGGKIVLERSLLPDETQAITVGTPDKLASSHLVLAVEYLKMITDVAAFNTRISPPTESVDLRPYGYVDRINSHGAYQIDEDMRFLDRRGRAAVRMHNEKDDALGIYCVVGGDIILKPGEEYELFLRYQASSSRVSNQESGPLSLQIAFVDYWSRKIIEPTNFFLNINIPEGQWTLYRTRISVPPEAYRLFITLTLKGRNVTVWFGDMVLARSEKGGAALAELNQRNPEDKWLAEKFKPSLVSLIEEITCATNLPNLERVQTLGLALTQLKEELAKRYPPNADLRNIEGWQRLNDGLTYVEMAQKLLIK